MAEGNEICAGCGAEASPQQVITDGGVETVPGTFPWVGVGSPDLNVHTTQEDDENPHPQDMVTYHVCDVCHKDPAHRTKNALKVHFHARENAKLALLAARNQTMLIDPTPAQQKKHAEYLKNKAKDQKSK